jgi:hypothetical protein
VSNRTILFSIPLTFSLIGLGGCAGLMDEPSAGNGGGYVVPPAPIPQQPSMIDGYGNPAPELQPMIDDPEAQEDDWSDSVLADDDTEARRKCQQLAETHRVTLVKVQKRTIKGKTYDCFFRPNN